MSDKGWEIDRPDMTYGFPGVGGSLGKCALCGDTFLHEILFGEMVATIHCSQLKDKPNLPMHRRCADIAEKCKTWMDFPAGPLRNAFEWASKKKVTP